MRTVKKLFEDATGEDFPINNVINVNFGSFRRAVNYIGGVYVDIDRDYFNDNSGGGERYAAIDINPGYQKLRGQDALDYVRYRHTDNDFIRAARQQDFLRQARGQAGVRRLVAVRDRKRLARVFGRYFEVDRSFRSTKEILSMLQAGVLPDPGEPERQRGPLPRRRVRQPDGRHAAVRLAGRAGHHRSRVHEREGAPRSRPRPPSRRRPTRSPRGCARSATATGAPSVAGLEESKAQGVDQAVLADPKLDFPFYFPTLRTTGAAYAGTEPRIYTIRDELGKKRHKAYRLVLSKGLAGEYYGVQGMTWKDPPILDGAHETRTVNGRKLLLYYDGKRLRLVAWQHEARRLLGVQHALAVAQHQADARDRRLPAAAQAVAAATLRPPR